MRAEAELAIKELNEEEKERAEKIDSDFDEPLGDM